MTILVDTNVLSDVIEADPNWAQWSAAQLQRNSAMHTLSINPVIYAELSLLFEQHSTLDHYLKQMRIEVIAIERPALFAAARAFKTYRQQGGNKRSPLPDFFIGAQAQFEQWPLLTRDVKRYRSYFPGVQLISPDQH